MLTCICVAVDPDNQRKMSAERRDLEAREEAMQNTGRELGLSLDQGRAVIGRERDKLKDEAEQLAKVLNP